MLRWIKSVRFGKGRSIWNLTAGKVGVADLHAGIDETGTPYRREVVQPHGQPFRSTEIFAKRVKCLKLPSLRPLSVARVKNRQLIVLARNSGGDTAIHSAAH